MQPSQPIHSMQKAKRKEQIDKQILEQKVLQNELSSLKKDAKVFRQQQNSNILFLSGVEQEMSRAKKNMDSLVKEYQELETSPAQEDSREGDEDGESSTPRENEGPG
ncbi:hypothetical protein BaRGS_00015714 [Batillaria attramentaria]|uniref:No apical meristem-associated C-terminal domain-containing protein n=1 Tax=Batillaria attramentaria TaxID=370345 RepID=A0ABD0L1L7_9CAEN